MSIIQLFEAQEFSKPVPMVLVPEQVYASRKSQAKPLLIVSLISLWALTAASLYFRVDTILPKFSNQTKAMESAMQTQPKSGR